MKPSSPDPSATLRLAVVGHTNTGKTSLLRTLTRDPYFGRVQDSPGTTRQVEGARLLLAGAQAVELYDTPGMEDGMGLLDYLDQLSPPAQRREGPDRILAFLDSPESTRRFEQEARVLRKLLECDAGLYVIDVRDPVLGKHRDELAVLGLCGRPLLPVLNFTHSPRQRADEWRTALARLGLHAAVEFDSVAPALDGESRLYDKLALMLDARAGLLLALKEDVLQQQAIRRDDALRMVAELLVDVAALRLPSRPDQASVEHTSEKLRKLVRERENACVRDLLRRYNFRAEDFPRHALPLQGERWGMDLFHPQALKDVGIHLGKGMAAGAMAGVTVDLFTAGLSLGAAALVGAMAGGLWQGADRLGKRIMGRIQGYREISVDDGVLRLLALRQLALVDALQRRGHAAQAPIVIDAGPPQPPALADADALHPDAPMAEPAAQEPESSVRKALRSGKLPAELTEARSQPHWSGLLPEHEEESPRREEAVRSLARLLGTV
ncbi:GTPase/DUF3482 domain-containing protein [Pusillimonas noertemannii]|uniref:GTPase/DUF3482 domain-containing protein n=1 Tax=Pusillimonas noertemannii TaxID=305977 RepID=UPI0002F50A0B|nr:GTPase/DUF3482 domain-containing protein [Pusillimonas noertemannii]